MMAWTAESQVPAVRYRVAIAPSAASDAEEVARILAAVVRGRIEPYAEQGFVGFVVVASPSSAEILARDPRVESVTVMSADPVVPASAAPSPIPPQPATPTVATELRTGRVATNASELLIGPYAYDGAGNVTEIGTSQNQFRYDALGRLKTSTVSGIAQEFTYDPYGNLDSVKTNGTTSTIGIDAATNRLKATGPYNVFGQYDTAGRMTAYLGRDSFVYDALDMVKESLVQNERKVHLYTAGDERLASVTISGGAETTSSWALRDVAGKVLRAYDKTMVGGKRWSWKEDYVYREGQLLAAEIDTSAKTLHFHADHLGTPRLITGNGGATVARHDYQPLGGEITAANQDSERMKFTGHERDFAGGVTSDPLDYMHARYYSPSAGRFLAADPKSRRDALKRPQLYNQYSYAANNPLKFVDPDGEDVTLFIRNNNGPGLTNFGHMAVRVFGKGYDYTFDFGRYRDTHMLVLGEGMLRVWSNYGAFLAKQASHGQAKTVTWQTSSNFDLAVMMKFFLLADSGEQSKQTAEFTEYKTPRDYSIFGLNCVTLSCEVIGEAEEETGTRLEGFDRFFGDIASPGEGWAAAMSYDSIYGPDSAKRIEAMDWLFNMMYSGIEQRNKQQGK